MLELIEIAIGRGDDASVDTAVLIVPDPAELLRLQYAQELQRAPIDDEHPRHRRRSCADRARAPCRSVPSVRTRTRIDIVKTPKQTRLSERAAALFAILVVGILMGGVYSLPAMAVTKRRDPFMTLTPEFACDDPEIASISREIEAPRRRTTGCNSRSGSEEFA